VIFQSSLENTTNAQDMEGRTCEGETGSEGFTHKKTTIKKRRDMREETRVVESRGGDFLRRTTTAGGWEPSD